MTVKRVDAAGLLVTTALWTRKAREADANPQVALLFHWPTAERQAHITGTAARAARPLELELFGERDPLHRIQTLVSRQGDPVEDLEPLRERAAHLARVEEAPPECPPDWGALRIEPDTIEFWTAATDRIHERRLFSREGEDWSETLLAP